MVARDPYTPTRRLTDADKAAWAAYEQANEAARLAYDPEGGTSASQRRASRADTCKRGHSLADAYTRTGGHLDCRTCRRQRSQARRRVK